MARRQSRRLQGLLPEVQSTRFTCFCLLEGDAADLGVTQTTCCRQFLHQSCQRRWFRSHSTCPLCRHDQTHQPTVPDGQPTPRLNNAAIIDRLSRLLTDPNLDQILSRVRTFFFFFFFFPLSPLSNRGSLLSTVPLHHQSKRIPTFHLPSSCGPCGLREWRNILPPLPGRSPSHLPNRS